MNPTVNARKDRTLSKALGSFLGLDLVMVFGVLGDLPSRVSNAKDEHFFVEAGRWISAAFWALAAINFMTTYGPVGFLALPVAVLIVARRLAASQGVPYEVSHLLNDIRTVLIGSRRLRYIAHGCPRRPS